MEEEHLDARFRASDEGAILELAFSPFVGSLRSLWQTYYGEPRIPAGRMMEM